jgi:hypothetical protein
MLNKGYTKFQNIIFTNKEVIINILKDFEDLEIENIEKWFKYKIIMNYHNHLWTILCDDITINIIEKTFIIYNIWRSFKNNIIIRVDPDISNKIIRESNVFIKKNILKVNIYQSFNNSTIIFIAGNNKTDVLDVMEFMTHKIDNYDINMQFIFIDLICLINTLRYILPLNINIEEEIQIKKSNFDNNLTYNEDFNKKRICIIGLSNNFNIIWYYIKKILFKNKIENLKNIEYLDIEINDIKKSKNVNKEKIKLISRKIIKNNMQIPQHRNKLPTTIYSTSI